MRGEEGTVVKRCVVRKVGEEESGEEGGEEVW